MTAPQLLDIKGVCARLSISRSCLYRELKRDFPKPIYPAERCPRWLESEIAAYADRLAAARAA